MSWLAAVIGAILGALIQSPLFWLAVLVGLMVWRARRVAK